MCRAPWVEALRRAAPAAAALRGPRARILLGAARRRSGGRAPRSSRAPRRVLAAEAVELLAPLPEPSVSSSPAWPRSSRSTIGSSSLWASSKSAPRSAHLLDAGANAPRRADVDAVAGRERRPRRARRRRARGRSRTRARAWRAATARSLPCAAARASARPRARARAGARAARRRGAVRSREGRRARSARRRAPPLPFALEGAARAAGERGRGRGRGRSTSSAASGTTSSPAAVGVDARTSAARSQSGVSCSWPTAETTGTGHDATARTSRSSLNGSRSSKLPPPRATTTTSTSGPAHTRASASTTAAAARGPCTSASATSTRAAGKRAEIVASTSRLAAASLPVTSPIRRGSTGSGRFRSARTAPPRRASPSGAPAGEMVAEAEPLDREGAEAEVAALLEQLRAPEDMHALAVPQVEPERVEARRARS